MESLAWSQAFSARSPLHQPSGSSQLNLTGSLDFTAMLNVSTALFSGSDSGNSMQSSVASSEYLVGSSPYPSWELDSNDQSNGDTQDSLQSEPASESTQSDQESDEPQKSEEQNENRSADGVPNTQSNPIETAPPRFQPGLEVGASAEMGSGPSAEAKPMTAENLGHDPVQSDSNPEIPKHQDSLTEHNPTEVPEDSQDRKLKVPAPTTATTGVSGEKSAQPETIQKANLSIPTASSSLAAATTESEAFSIESARNDEGFELARPPDNPISAEEDSQRTIIDQDKSDQSRDSRGVANRRGKAARWFQRTEPELALGVLHNSANGAANQLDLTNHELPVDQTGYSSNAQGTVYTTEIGQSRLPQADLLASAPAGPMPPHSAHDPLGPVAQSLSSSTQGTVVASAVSSATEASGSLQPSLGNPLGNEVRYSELGPMDRVQANSHLNATDTTTSGNASTISNSTSDANSNLVRAERLRMIQRVARSFQRLGNTGGTVQLRLHPPELGSLSMQVQIDGRSMAARLTTESAAARDVIMDSLPQLRSRLAEQGYEVTQIKVDVADASLGGSQSQWSSSTSSQSGQDGNSQEFRGVASDLRRSAYLRRQLDASRLPAASSLPQSASGNRGIDLHA